MNLLHLLVLTFGFNTSSISHVVTFYPNLNYKNVMKTISLLLKNFKDQTTQLKFANSKLVLALNNLEMLHLF